MTTLEKKQKDFANELVVMHAMAHALGLHVTGHALHLSVKAVGYEMAGDVETAGKAARGELGA